MKERAQRTATTGSSWHLTLKRRLGPVCVGVLLIDTLLISTIPSGTGSSFISAFIKRSPLISQLWNVLSERSFLDPQADSYVRKREDLVYVYRVSGASWNLLADPACPSPVPPTLPAPLRQPQRHFMWQKWNPTWHFGLTFYSQTETNFTKVFSQLRNELIWDIVILVLLHHSYKNNIDYPSCWYTSLWFKCAFAAAIVCPVPIIVPVMDSGIRESNIIKIWFRFQINFKNQIWKKDQE